MSETMKEQRMMSMPVTVTRKTEKGSALLVSLVMLLLITLVAVGSMQGTILQERMTANLRDRDLAFQAAEAALREAEAVAENNLTNILTNQNGLYSIGSDDTPDWRTRTLDEGNGAIEYVGDFPGVAVQPRFYVERIDTLQPAGTETEAGVSLPPPPYFRITAIGFGGSVNTSVVLTSVYRAE